MPVIAVVVMGCRGGVWGGGAAEFRISERLTGNSFYGYECYIAATVGL